MNKTFSIIIPIYNTEKYLPDCIESVINQTYKNLEIILVNDGSMGNAEEICKSYCEKDSRIKYFSKENEGVAIARNFGISKATGDYVFCVDSDDTIAESLIEDIFNSFQETDSDFVIVGSTFNNISIIGCLPTCSFAVKKELLNKYPDIRFQEKIQPCEDGLFSHKLLALTNKIALCSCDGYKYNRHGASSEHNIKPDILFIDIQKWLDILEDFYNKYNLLETHKLHLLTFIQNEPFSRLKTVKFSFSQKIFLLKLMKQFINKNNLFSKENGKFFSKDFQMFLESKSVFTYLFKKFFSIKNIFSIENTFYNCRKEKVLTVFWIKLKIKRNI